jgi:rhodanese-related sulfurtransferase
MKISTMLKFLAEYLRERHIRALSPREVLARLGQPDFYVFDSNLISEWRRAHIPGANYVGLDSYAPEVLPPDKSAALLFYCYNPI